MMIRYRIDWFSHNGGDVVCCVSSLTTSSERTMMLSTFQNRLCALGLSLIAILGNCVEGKGGEKAAFDTKPFSPDISHRQNFCERYKNVIQSNGTFTFKDALNGAQIRPVIQYGAGFPYFNYDPETGIDAENPGLIANILDYVAERANFTWRDSFAVYTGDDKGDDKTWTEMLGWTTETFDISVDKWCVCYDRFGYSRVELNFNIPLEMLPWSWPTRSFSRTRRHGKIPVT